MIELDRDVPPGVDAVRAVGTLTPDDYRTVVVPLIERAIRERRGLRLLCAVDEAFTGLTPAAAWEDVRLGVRAMRHLTACAVVSDLGWVRDATRVAAFVVPGHVRVFGASAREEALRWLVEAPGHVAAVRSEPGRGLVVAEIAEPLRREDVDAIAAAVDRWLGTHRELPGLVLHARSFPGWEDAAGLVRHLRFVGGHQHRIRRVALVVDGIPDAVVRTVGRVLHPDVRRFPADAVAEATDWAAG